MLIVIEGVDGAGKTTLAEALVEVLKDHKPTKLLHRGPLEFDPLVEYELDLDDYRPAFGQHVVCDRWHWGEDIYGPLYRAGSRLTPAIRTHVELFLQSRGAVFLLMCQSRTEIHRRLDERGETFLRDEHRNDVIESYYVMAASSLIKTTAVNTSAPEIVQLIVHDAWRQEQDASALNVFPTYVGPRRPAYLLLGERRNPLKSGGHLAAFVPYGGTSGAYLLEHVPADVRQSLGLANAMEEDVHALWCTLEHPRVVTLGREAHERCNLADVPHGAVPHPQYVRRFHNAHGEEYGRVIRDAVLHTVDLTGWRP